jgi:signal transduction histidine kinase/CheY-like chemotaxis protein/HPt (histidine-containing phosphotransfer) domain-containing protein
MDNRRSWLFTAVTTALFALPLTIMLLTGLFFVVERSRKDLEQTATQTGKLLGAFIAVNVNQLEVLASDRRVSDPDAPIADRLAAVTPYADISGIRNIYITDRGGMGASIDGSKRSFSRERFFIQTRHGSTGVSYRLSGQGDTEDSFAISVPLYSGNAFSGSLIQLTPWNRITALINSLNFDKTGFAYIHERNGVAPMDPRTGLNDARTDGSFVNDPLDDDRAIHRRFSSGEIGSGQVDSKEGRWLIGFAPIDGTNWSIGITTPLSEVLDHAWVMVLFYLALVSLTFAFTGRYYRRRLMLQEEKDEAIMRLQAANDKLASQSDIISAMAERRITESESQYHDLFETMSSGALLHEMILDGNGRPTNFRYLSVNGMAERMFHLDRDEVIGKTYRDLYPEPSEELVKRMNDIAFGTGSTRLPDFETNDGLVIRNMAYSPKPGQFVTLYDDITAEVRAQEELAVEREKLIRATKAAEEANRAKGKFLANMSHEIRTPLNAIIGLADVEIETHEEPLTVRTFTAIREAARNLMTLLNDILDYSKMEAGKLSLDPKPFTLEETVNNALTVTTPRLSGKRVNMLVDYDTSLPSVVVGDPVRIWQILKNLLDNAGKFTAEGQILITVQNAGEGKVRFVVSDTGCGIPPGQIGKLFEAFEQGNSELARKTGGTGLGLSITKQLVEMMSGTIEVSSALGIGTTFTVTLPLQAPEGETETGALALAGTALSGKRILVADDDPNARVIIKGIIEKFGAAADCVATGEDAVARAVEKEDAAEPYDLIVLDLQLPGLNGIETANELRQSLRKRPSFILVTAWSKNFSIDDIQSAGFAETIDKPFVPSTVVNKIARALSETRGKSVAVASSPREQYRDARVLAVEDNAQNRDVINRMLFLFGINADFAVNGLDAIEKTKTNQYDLVFMDIQMPEMNGLEATKLIRAREAAEGLPPVPIVAMTAYAMAEDVRESLDVGMDAHITKPIEIGTLRNTLDKYVGRKKGPLVGPPVADGGTESKETEGLTAFDCVDAEEGLTRLGGDVALFLRLLAGLRDMLERPQPEFESAMSGDMINATARFIHTVKGLAGNLGVTELFRVTGELETDMRAHKPHKAKYEEYRSICAEVFSELNGKIARNPLKQERKAPQEVGSDDELAEALESLIVPLETGDASAVEEIMDKLKSKKFKRLGRKRIEELAKLASVFDYDTMLERVSALR